MTIISRQVSGSAELVTDTTKVKTHNTNIARNMRQLSANHIRPSNICLSDILCTLFPLRAKNIFFSNSEKYIRKAHDTCG